MMLPAYASRFVARRPAFSTALILTLALGIGADTAMFSLARAVVLRPLPYEDPERLVFVWSHRAGAPIVHERHGILTGTDVLEWQRRATSLESVAVISSSRNNPTDALDLVTADGTERLRSAAVTPNFFQLFGVHARVGRTFTSAHDGEGTPRTTARLLFSRPKRSGHLRRSTANGPPNASFQPLPAAPEVNRLAVTVVTVRQS